MMDSNNNLLSQIRSIIDEAMSNFSQEVKDIIHDELAEVSKRLQAIALLKLNGEIDDDEFKQMIEVEQNAAVVALYTIKGLSKLVTQDAMNQALGVAVRMIIKLI